VLVRENQAPIWLDGVSRPFVRCLSRGLQPWRSRSRKERFGKLNRPGTEIGGASPQQTNAVSSRSGTPHPAGVTAP
jgi:hypothetical protein